MCLFWCCILLCVFFFFSSRRRHTRCLSDWSSDVCSSDLPLGVLVRGRAAHGLHHGHGGEVLTRDELEPVFLALHLAADERVDGRIGLAERRAAVDHGRAVPASILCTRRTWRPPSKAVSSHLWRISI